VDKNPGDAREGSITFTAGDLTLDVPFKQAANENMLTGKTATEIAKSVVAGWNIGNSLEAYSDKAASETGFGNPLITRTLIEGIKAAGINAVRLPCAWDGYIEDESTYKIKDSWLERVDEVVSWCLENDLYVIVNIHWDGGWLEENCTADKKDANVKEQKALWTQIATKLGVYDQHLLFAGCNEPNVSDADQMAVLKEYEQAFIDAVRATGGHNAERALIVQGPSTDIDKTDKLFGDMPTDKASNLLMAEVHYYDPWQFCGLEADASWGKAHYFWGDNVISGSDRNSTGTLQDIKNQFKKMKEMFVDKGIPVILGEYGAITNHDSEISDATQLAAHHQSRYDLNEAVTREAKNYGLVPFMWDTGEHQP
jgi:aryl-phospho-beta-D-glucosidase BglC (GH1 family)